MAVILLDDGHARVEMTVFNELFEANRSIIKEDQLLLVEGKVSLDEYSGGLRIAADKLYDLTAARSRFAKGMKLHCNGEASAGTSVSGAAKLKELLAPYRDNSGGGNRGCPVSVVYRNHSASCELELGDAWRVSLHDNLLQALSQHLKRENVEVVY